MTGKKPLACVGAGPSPQTHFELLGVQRGGITLDWMKDVDQFRVRRPENVQLASRMFGDPIVQVNVLQAPAVDGRVQSTNVFQVTFEDADDAESVESPVASILVNLERICSLRVRATDERWVILAENNGEVDLVAADGMRPDALQRSAVKDHVDVDENQKADGS